MTSGCGILGMLQPYFVKKGPINMLALRKRTEKKIVLLPIEELSPNPMQPRSHFDTDSLAALSESIKQHGILQPITVRQADTLPYPDDLHTPSFEIIAGERRWRAAKLAGFEKVPCVIRDADREQSAVLALIENLQRRDLGYFEEARAIRNLLLMTSLSQADMASRLSLSPSALSNKLRLLKLSESEQQLIEENALGERHARAVLKIHDKSRRKDAILQIAREGLSAQDAELLADRFNEDHIAPEGEKPKSAKPAQRISLIRDVRFFFNTLDRAVTLLTEAGFAATQERTEVDGGYEIRLFVPKR